MGTDRKSLSGKTMADNRNAFHEYFIEQRFTAGIVLSGTKVKSIRAGKCQLRGSYARIEDGEAWLYDAHITLQPVWVVFNHDPTRKRKLLLKRREIHEIYQLITRRGYTFVPLRIFFDNQYVKVEVGVAKGKKQHDKREAIAERDVKRDIDRQMKLSNR